MDGLADITQAQRALRKYLAGGAAKFPSDVLARLEDLVDSPSPVDAIVGSAELLYANRQALDDDGRTIVAQLIGFATMNRWHGLSDADNRGSLIQHAMLRELGERAPAGHKFQKADADPAPRAEFITTPATG